MRHALGLLTVLTLLVGTTESRSQALIMLLLGDKISNENMMGGLQGGVALTTFTTPEQAQLLPGWSLGAFMEFRLSDQWFISPEVTFKTPGGAENVTGNWSDRPEIDTLLTEVGEFSSLSYFSIPVLFKFRLGSSGFVAGPQIGYALAATDNITGTGPSGGTVSAERLSFYRLNRWDVGVVVGYEYLLDSSLGMQSLRIGARFYQGFLDVYHNDAETTLNRGFTLTFGIPLGGSGKAHDETK